MDGKNTRRIVLLGKTGSGKSSLANTIFGDDFSFRVNYSPNSETKICQSETRTVHGRSICLIDTPGLFNTNPNSSTFSPEIMKCLEACAPGPHAFLLVLKLERYTSQVQAVVNLMLRHFSEEALKYTTLVFTHGDNLPAGTKIKQWAHENEALRNLVQKCGGRCHVIDNKHWSNNQGEKYQNNQNQVQDLLNTIKQTVAANEDTVRIVLLGKTGSGKSSLANTIFGNDSVFKVNDSPNSETKICQSKTRTVHGRSICLIDTPGFFDTDPNSSELGSEIMKCLEACAPGPHAFLLVLKVEKYTKQEQAVVNLILQYFSEEALKYTTLVFTHGDDLPVGMRIKEWAQQNEALRNLVQKCGGRCHVVDNKYWRNNQGQIYRNNQNHVQDLLNTIDQTVAANGGSHFTSDLLQNKSLWGRFKDAPVGVKVAALLGVGAVGVLLYYTVPWAKVIEIVVSVAKGVGTAAVWVWENREEVMKVIEFLVALYLLFKEPKQTCS